MKKCEICNGVEECILCKRRREKREYYHENKKRMHETHKEWLSNPDNYQRSLEKAREYKRKNNLTINKKRANRMSNDPIYKISEILRSRLRSAINYKYKRKKSKKTLDYIGCSKEELIVHIENQFEDWMNWGNWGNGSGQWNLDHIIPCTAFNLSIESEIEECFSFLNTAPISREDNIRKLDKHLDCTLIVFSSIKGHYGRFDHIKYTISNIDKELDVRNFRERVVHIKTEDGHEERFNEIKTFCESFGFKVISSHGNWKHNDPSHALEYYKDMVKTFNHHLCSKTKYFLTFEDDFIPNKNSNISWFDLLLKGKGFLDKNEEILCIRMNRDIENDLTKANKIEENIFLQGECYTPWGPTYTFQPTFVRADIIKSAWNLIYSNKEVLKTTHCELISGYALKNFTKTKTPFAFFDPNIINSIHIGEPNFDEVIKNYNLEIQKPRIDWNLNK